VFFEKEEQCMVKQFLLTDIIVKPYQGDNQIITTVVLLLSVYIMIQYWGTILSGKRLKT